MVNTSGLEFISEEDARELIIREGKVNQDVSLNLNRKKQLSGRSSNS